jgi:hypothetical protein
VIWIGLGQQFAFIKNRVKKNMDGQKSTYFSPLVMLKISHAFQTIKHVNGNIVVKLKYKYH